MHQDSGAPSQAHGSESASVLHKPRGQVRMCLRMCRWILLKCRFRCSRFGEGTPDSFQYSLGDADVAGAWAHWKGQACE